MKKTLSITRQLSLCVIVLCAMAAFFGLNGSVSAAAAVPGAFNKISPVNNAQSGSSVTLTWGAAKSAVSYEYCIGNSNWSCEMSGYKSVSSARKVTVTGLVKGRTYWWQVQARNSTGAIRANGGTFWTFTVTNAPGTFSKSSPEDGSNTSLSPTLSWAESSDAAYYQVCYA
ncbi:MAG: fibronectin type III domain-containing protein, partial [Chloroflexota bacterium]